MLTELRWKKIKALVFMLFSLMVSQCWATASVSSLNQCPDMIFIDGIENESLPSGGFGGVYPGNVDRSVQVTQTFNSTYYVYIPTSYSPLQPMPMVFLWHGAGGAGTAPDAAQSMRTLWDATAESNDFIIVAQVATGSQGGGFIPNNAETIMLAILADMEASYNIETTRIYGWGFSSGGHVMHHVVLDNADIFSAYAVNAGVLAASAGNQAPNDASRIMPVFVSVGNQDTLLSYTQADRQVFLNAGWIQGRNYWLDQFNGSHVVPSNAPTKAWNKICISTNLD